MPAGQKEMHLPQPPLEREISHQFQNEPFHFGGMKAFVRLEMD